MWPKVNEADAHILWDSTATANNGTGREERVPGLTQYD
jgi:hypothetical protein